MLTHADQSLCSIRVFQSARPGEINYVCGGGWVRVSGGVVQHSCMPVIHRMLCGAVSANLINYAAHTSLSTRAPRSGRSGRPSCVRITVYTYAHTHVYNLLLRQIAMPPCRAERICVTKCVRRRLLLGCFCCCQQHI